MILAVLGAIFFWGLSILSSIIVVFNKFSQNKILTKYQIFNNIRYSVILNLIILPILSGLIFRVGQEIETTPGVHWGCYLESVMIGEFFLIFILFMILTVLLIIGLIKKQFLGFQRKRRIVYSYLILIIAPIIVSILNMVFIGIFSSSLSGSCL